MSENKQFIQIFDLLGRELVDDSIDLLKEFQLPMKLIQDGANASKLKGDMIISVIGYSNDTLRGALTLLANRSTVQNLDPGGIDLADDDELLSDIFGELANQMLGRFKNSLLPRGIALQVTTPTTICGSNLRFPHHTSGLSNWLHLSDNSSSLYIRLDATFELNFELLELEHPHSEGSVLDEGEMMFF